jgi:hypothetical protein
VSSGGRPTAATVERRPGTDPGFHVLPSALIIASIHDMTRLAA